MEERHENTLWYRYNRNKQDKREYCANRTSFLDRIYTEKEQEYCEKSNKMKYQHYAARFAAKEAIFKAISKNINDTSDWVWKNIEIYNDEQGKPIADISKLEIKNIISMDLSISHIKDYALASFTLILDN